MLRLIAPPLWAANGIPSALHKGQAGRIGVIGGCAEYTGAPYFAAIACMRLGCDLVHVFCERKSAAQVIKSYSPDLIVHPYLLSGSQSTAAAAEDTISVGNPRDSVVDSIAAWFDRLHSLVIGPGLGRDPFMIDCVSTVLMRVLNEDKYQHLAVVIDADGLWLLQNNLHILQTSRFGGTNLTLTPNEAEFRRLLDTTGIQATDSNSAVENLSRALCGASIVVKGPVDRIVQVSDQGTLKRVGGQGDILSGIIATLLCWKNQSYRGVYGEEAKNELLKFGDCDSITLKVLELACQIMRRSSLEAWSKYKRSMLASDIPQYIQQSFEWRWNNEC